MGAGVVDQDSLGWCGSEVVDNLGEGQRALGRSGKGVDGTADIDRGVIIVEEGFSAGCDVGKIQLGGRLAGS